MKQVVPATSARDDAAVADAAERLRSVPAPRTPSDPALPAATADRVDAALRRFVAGRGAELGAISPDLAPVSEAVLDLARKGKRLRAAFCHAGWRGAGGPSDDPGDAAAVTAGAALELFHVAALVHDDVMDRSDTRRGMPAVHRRFAEAHRTAGLDGDAEHHGTSVAILVGDLCLGWSDELLHTSDVAPAPLLRAGAVFATMRTEVIGGQYLDLLEQVRRAASVASARQVLHYKSAKYSVEHPLVLGGTLAGASPALLEGYAGFGLPVGEAFQLRDDLLGVFGDPDRTGKPSGDDLREGKKTLLTTLATERADARERLVLRLLGRPDLDADGVEALRDVLRATGAVAEVERRIETLTDEALHRLSQLDLPGGTTEELTRLTHACVDRAA